MEDYISREELYKMFTPEEIKRAEKQYKEYMENDGNITLRRNEFIFYYIQLGKVLLPFREHQKRMKEIEDSKKRGSSWMQYRFTRID